MSAAVTVGRRFQAPALRRRPRRAVTPEHSKVLRVVVLAITMLSVMAVAGAGAVDPGTTAAALVLIPAGSWLAYRRRSGANVALKLLLAAGLVAALMSFVSRARAAQSVDEARVMLGSLFVWVQVLHSFDLPRRRDLSFSVAASVVLMAEAGSLSLDGGFGLLVLPYGVLGPACRLLCDRAVAADGADRADVRPATGAPPRRALAVRSVAGMLAGVVVAGAVAFAFTPRLPGARVLAPPFSIVNNVAIPGWSGGVVNPGASGASGAGRGAGGTGYPGFGSSVDLRVRGHLSDRMVMRVRSPQPALWRGQAYDTFDGTTWTASSPAIQEFGQGTDSAIELGSLGTEAPTHPLLQTFFIERRQPNIVFAAASAQEVFFPANRVAVDRFGSIRSPIMLEPETVYSVVSDVPDAPPALLRSVPPPYPGVELSGYTQLPAGLPARVVRLAHRITDGQPTAFDKVIAVQRWLRRNTRYSLDIPPDPPGADAVDQFLFVRREGFCEQIASAMAVLLRAVGVPTRFAVGFGPGDHNLLTGYWEVRESDAHGWVEVYYPRVGWIEYDPTFGVPAAAPGWGTRFIVGELAARLWRFVIAAVPGPVRRAVGAVAGGAAGGWPVAAGAVLLGVGLWVLRRRRRRRKGRAPTTPAAAAWESMVRTFARRGHALPPHRTPGEHRDVLLAADSLARGSRPAVDDVVDAYQEELFARGSPTGERVARATAAAASLATRSRG